MTTKRERSSKPKAAKRPKLKKETVRDLDVKQRAEKVRGGSAPVSNDPCASL